MEDRNLRIEFRRAIDAVAPPAPWLGAAIREELRKRRNESAVERVRRTPAPRRFAIAGLTTVALAVLVGAAFLLAQLYTSISAPIPAGHPSPSPTASPTSTALTAAEQAQLALLEARPLMFPQMPANGQCPDGPNSTITPYRDGTTSIVWGTGTVFAEGGNRTLTSVNAYFDVTFYTDPTVRGVVLIRGQQLGGRFNVVYVGDNAAGPVVGTDTITGAAVEQHAEAALPADRPPSHSTAAPGWGIWNIRQGINRTYSGCTGIQFDTASGSQVIVAHDPFAPA